MDENFEQLVEKAYKLHTSGNLTGAKEAYENLLKQNPENLNLLNLYALLNYALKNYDTALDIFNDIYEKTGLEDIRLNIIKIYLITKDYEKAIKTAESAPFENDTVIRLTGQAYMNIKDYSNAVKCYMHLISLNKNISDDIFNLSLAYSYINDFENAIKYALSFYNENNTDISICLHLASLYDKTGDKENQIVYLLKAQNLQPPNADLLYNIGVLYRQIGNDEEALKYFNNVINIDNNYKSAYLNIARIYGETDKKSALDLYEELPEKFPNDETVLSQLYIAYKEMFKNDKAYNTALKLTDISPKEQYPYFFAAAALYGLGRYEEALKMYEKSKQFGDDNQDADIMIANIYSLFNRGNEAIEIFKTKYPELTEFHDNYAFIQLCERNLDEARNAMHKHLTTLRTQEELDKRALKFFYKLKLHQKYNINETEFKKYKTDKTQKDTERTEYYLKKDLFGKNPDNKRILVYSANGMGDLIMFSRYLHILEKHTKNIILQAPESMQRILKYNFPEYEYANPKGIIDEKNYDYTSSFYCLLLNLQEANLKDIPFSAPYLNIEDELVKEKSEYDFIKKQKKKIGIFWMGNPVIMPQRSITPNKLKPLFEIENSQIYSFQIDNFDYDSSELRKELPFFDLAPYIKDYADTAAFLKNMDVLVTVDSSIAHLSGALGIKTFLMLPFEAEWRWFHDTKTTPWYNSISIFKQKIPFDWDEVIERIKNELTI